MKKQLLIYLFLITGISLFSQGNCLDFDGINDDVNMGDVNEFDGIAQMTLEAWIKPDAFGNNNPRLISKGSANGMGSLEHLWIFNLVSNQGDINFTLDNTGFTHGSVETTHTPLTAGVWTHVVMIYDGSQGADIDKVEFYINGREVADVNKSVTGALPATTSSSNNFSLRLAEGGAGSPFNGQMDEVRMWTGLRTEAQIREHMYCPFTNPNGETNLEAYYNFNETTGTNLPDQATTNAHDGTLIDMMNDDWVTSGALSTAANGLDFDGGNDNVNAGDVDALDGIGALTIEMWFNADDLTSDRTLIAKRVDANNQIRISFQGTNTISLEVGNGSSSGGTFPFTSTNTWHHVALVFDGGGAGNADRLKGYLDGVQQTLTFSGTIPATTDNNSANLQIGDSNAAANAEFDGTMDELRIWSTVRSQAQISGNLGAEIDCSTAGLIAYYRFNQAVASGDNLNFTCLSDCTSNLNHGTLNTFALNSSSTSNWVSGTTFVLPVELVSFDARQNDKSAYLTWETASETQNRGWEIEHSTDGQNWDWIGFEGGRGDTYELNSYSFTHETPSPGTNYYRLKQVDYDGNFEYSDVRSVNFFDSESRFSVYPNPTQNGYFTLYIPDSEAENKEMTLYDYLGRVVRKTSVSEGRTEINTEGLNKGMYWVQLDLDRRSGWKKVIIQ